MSNKPYDFGGWATRNNVECGDGRIIRENAFKHCDGITVPLVWNHRHDGADNVLGYATLHNRPEGVYTYGYFNDTERGKTGKELVQHGDIKHLSIYANHLEQKKRPDGGLDVMHGAIREVSLVLAGCNPGAYIDSVIQHSDGSYEEADIYTDEEIELYHAEKVEEKEEEKGEPKMADKPVEKPAEKPESEETIGDVFNTLSEKQKTVVYALIGEAINNAKGGSNEDEEGDGKMKHNIFEGDYENEENVLSHAEMLEIFSDMKRYGSLKDAVLQHGIENIEYMFPDAKYVSNTPDWIKREDGWVSKFLNGTHHTPFARIKSLHANITEDEARALGYIKGNLKKEEVFSLLKRKTEPTTIYKKQKLDRDDLIDITDFEVVGWLKSEMRMMLNEEIARAGLVGDQRLSSSDDKISEQNIRPIWTDSDLYTVKKKITFTSGMTDDQKSKAIIRAAVKSRKDYKGSGNPVFFTTEDVLTDMLLMEDNQGRVIYETVDKLKSALRVSDIVTVPVMEGLQRTDADGDTVSLIGIIVNLNDYNIGADKGGEVNMFDDFDIDYNAQKYLIETRCSGALVKPYSAIAIEAKQQ